MMYRGCVNDVPNQTVNDVPSLCERCTESRATSGVGNVNDVPNRGDAPGGGEGRCERCTELGPSRGARRRRNVNDVPSRGDARRAGGARGRGGARGEVNDVPS